MIEISESTCDYCGTCVGVCPENCISLRVNRLIIDHEICTMCRRCILICPVTALNEENAA